MNINLLPQENIRNKAPMYVVVFLLVLFLLLSSIYGILFIKNNTNIKNKQQELTQQQLILAQLKLETENLKKQQATAMKNKIADIKEKTIQIGPIVTALDQQVSIHQGEILGYSFEFLHRKKNPETGEVEEETDIQQTEQGEEYFVVPLNVEFDTISKSADTITELEKLAWNDKVLFKTLKTTEKTNQNTNASQPIAEVIYELHVVTDKLATKGVK